MGSSQSTTIRNAYKQLTSITNNLYTQQQNDGTATNINVNSFTFKNEGTIKNCGWSLGQVITSSQQVKVNSSFLSTANIQNIVEQFVNSESSSVQEAKNGFLNTALSLQKTNLSTEVDLQTFLTTNISNIQTQSCQALNDNLNKGVLINSGTIDCSQGGKLDAVQDIFSQQMVDCTANMITNNWLKNEDFKQIINKMEADQKAKGGLSLGGLIVILVIIVVVILAIALLPKLLSRSASSELSGLSNQLAASAMMGGMGGGGYGRGYGRGRR